MCDMPDYYVTMCVFKKISPSRFTYQSPSIFGFEQLEMSSDIDTDKELAHIAIK